MRVLFAGDIHGNTDHMSWVGRQAHAEGCDYIVACGDFGYWPHFEFGQSFLRHVDDVCRDAGVNLVWVDGNHENHETRGSSADPADLHLQSAPLCPPSRDSWRGYRPASA